jgi:hypothetical protein
MGPPSYMGSVVGRKVRILQRIFMCTSFSGSPVSNLWLCYIVRVQFQVCMVLNVWMSWKGSGRVLLACSSVAILRSGRYACSCGFLGPAASPFRNQMAYVKTITSLTARRYHT